MGERQYVWADPSSSQQHIGLSSIVEAMKKEDLYAIARWATKDGMDVKMGILAPVEFENVDCLLWSQVGSHTLLNGDCPDFIAIEGAFCR